MREYEELVRENEGSPVLFDVYNNQEKSTVHVFLSVCVVLAICAVLSASAYGIFVNIQSLVMR